MYRSLSLFPQLYNSKNVSFIGTIRFTVQFPTISFFNVSSQDFRQLVRVEK